MPKTELADLLETLDEETRVRWSTYLRSIEDEIAENGACTVKEHLDSALEHLLAVGWALKRCYQVSEADTVLGPLGNAAHTVERIRDALIDLAKKPEFSQ